MLVKVEKNLQADEYPAHTVVIKDDLGNNIFAAMHVGDGIVF